MKAIRNFKRYLLEELANSNGLFVLEAILGMVVTFIYLPSKTQLSVLGDFLVIEAYINAAVLLAAIVAASIRCYSDTTDTLRLRDLALWQIKPGLMLRSTDGCMSGCVQRVDERDEFSVFALFDRGGGTYLAETWHGNSFECEVVTDKNGNPVYDYTHVKGLSAKQWNDERASIWR